MEATAGLVLRLRISADRGVSEVRCLSQLCQTSLSSRCLHSHQRQGEVGGLCSVIE